MWWMSSLHCRHPGEGRDPAVHVTTARSWAPAFAGVTPSWGHPHLIIAGPVPAILFCRPQRMPGTSPGMMSVGVKTKFLLTLFLFCSMFPITPPFGVLLMTVSSDGVEGRPAGGA